MKAINKTLFILYFILLFWYGLFVKFLFGTAFYSYLKFLPEVLLLLFIISLFFIFKIKGLDKPDLIISFLLVLFLVISLLQYNGINNVAFLFRDFLLPIFSLIILRCINIDRDMKHFYIKTLAILSILFLISNLYFGYKQHYSDYTYLSSFYSGQVYYGTLDGFPVSIKISNGLIRGCGLVGDYTKYGIYSVLSFLFISMYFKKKPIYFLTFILAIFNVVFSTSKTALMCLLILFVSLYCLEYANKHRKKQLFISALFAGILIGFVYLFVNFDKLNSLQERFKLWGEYLNYDFNNLIIGVNSLNYFGEGNGFYSVMDNTFLFGTSSIGLLLFIVIFGYFIYLTKNNKNYLSLLLTICFVIMGMTINLFSGRCFFGIYCLILGLLSNNSTKLYQPKKSFNYMVRNNALLYGAK